MFNHILLPVNDFVLEKADFKKLTDLAERDHARVTFVHISDPLPPAFYLQNGFGGDYVTVPEHHRACETYADRLFKRAAEMVGPKIPTDSFHAFESDVTDGILTAADKTNSDVIMMVSHKRPGIAEMFVGSETRSVIAESKVPVLVI